MFFEDVKKKIRKILKDDWGYQSYINQIKILSEALHKIHIECASIAPSAFWLCDNIKSLIEILKEQVLISFLDGDIKKIFETYGVSKILKEVEEFKEWKKDKNKG